MQEGLTTSDGLRLALSRWPAGRAWGDGERGVAVIVHGLGEHCLRYEHVARRLNAMGLDVLGYDHRGHGRSAGRRGAMPAADSLCADLGAVLRAAGARPGGPIVLVGHSLGGLVAGRFVAEGLSERPAAWWQPVDALILSSPALAVDATFWQRVLLRVVAPLLPGLVVDNGLEAREVSRDPAVAQACAADALMHHRISGRLGRFISTQGPAVVAAAPRWRTPTLLMWAGADQCVDPAGSAAFAAAAPPAVVTARAWPGLYHEIFNEPEQSQVMDALAEWLQRHVACA